MVLQTQVVKHAELTLNLCLWLLLRLLASAVTFGMVRFGLAGSSTMFALFYGAAFWLDRVKRSF